MTFTNQTNRTSATGNAAVGQTVAFAFPINASSDLLVIQRVTATGVETTLAETTNYTVKDPSGLTDPTADWSSGGTLTTVTAVAATAQIHIIRNTPMQQTLDLAAGGTFNAENLEAALDKNTKLVIENDDGLGRSVRFPKTDPAASRVAIPNSIERASSYLTFDASGIPTATSTLATGTATISAFGATVIDDANADAAMTTLQGIPVINVRSSAYGAVGDGSTDDTTAIQAAITAGANKIVYFPYQSGAYMTDKLILVSNTTLVFDPGVTVKLRANEDTRLFQISDLSNIRIFGGIFDGDQTNQTPTGQEHCLDFRGCTRVLVQGSKCINAGGDGIYLGSTASQAFCENVTIDSVVCDANYRQGLTLISGKNVSIMNGVFSNTDGGAPEAGIDVEPNANTDFIQGVHIHNCMTKGNDGAGITIGIENLAGSAAQHDVTVSNCTSLEDNHGFAVAKTTGAIEAVITFDGCKAISSVRRGFGFRAPDAPRIDVRDCYVLNCATGAGASSKYDSAFSVYDEAADSMTTVKNVHFYNCHAQDEDSNMPRGYAVNLEAGTTASGLSYSNCTSSGESGSIAYFYDTGVTLENVTGLPQPGEVALLSTTTVAFNANAETTIYVVPNGLRCILDHVKVVAGADASTTDLSIGQNGAETDFVGVTNLDNLDAQYDMVILAPVPSATPATLKSYAAGTVIRATVANQAGGATNTLYLYGTLY